METLKGKPIASSPSRQKRPLLLYLPGMDGTGKLFYRQAQALQAEFHVRPLSLNHPAAGQSWESLADWVGSQLDEGAYLCGESFGACLALAVAAQQPERCRGLILVNPASSLRRRPWWWAGHVLLPFLPPALYHQMAERGLYFWRS
jgi:pimeloyl-ACP methyl ester carboxylesterase